MLWENRVLIAALTAWSLAQILKVPIEFWRSHKWDWSLLFTAGGMPSSHSALVTAAAHAIGLYEGFDSPLYALSVVVTMIVVYDATGIRRQAGRHAEMINAMMHDLMQGHPLQEQQLREMLGHTPLQAFMGILLGLTIAQIFTLFW
ncbi:MAG: divergent PAP2 family protein [Anaerolineales bacterium]